jgi:DNA-binding SARP family transcriptional activator
VLRVAGEWRELAELDPTDEEAHVQLMRRHLAAGKPAAAIRQYEYLERTLERHLSATTGASARQARRDADNLLRDAVGSRTRLGELLSEFAALLNGQNAALADLSAN